MAITAHCWNRCSSAGQVRGLRSDLGKKGSPLSVPHLLTPLTYSDLSCSVIVLRNGGYPVKRTFPDKRTKAPKIIRIFFLVFLSLSEKKNFIHQKEANKYDLWLRTVNYFLYISSTIIFLCQLKTPFLCGCFLHQDKPYLVPSISSISAGMEGELQTLKSLLYRQKTMAFNKENTFPLTAERTCGKSNPATSQSAADSDSTIWVVAAFFLCLSKI